MNGSEIRLGRSVNTCPVGRILAAALLVTSLTVLSPACSSSDDGGGGGMTTIPCIAFRESAASQPGTVVAQEGPNSTCDIMDVDLIVTDVNDLFAATFDVTYPAGISRFGSATEIGSVLASDGAAVSVNTGEPQPGTVTVGISRLNTSTGVDVAGGQLLVRLRFVRTGTQGSGTIGFSRAELLDPSQPPDPIPGIQWFGGDVNISQQ